MRKYLVEKSVEKPAEKLGKKSVWRNQKRKLGLKIGKPINMRGKNLKEKAEEKY